MISPTALRTSREQAGLTYAEAAQALGADNYEPIYVKRHAGESQKRLIRRDVAVGYLRQLNAKTTCMICGAQPIDWHHRLPRRPGEYTVAHLAHNGASIHRINSEIDKCDPLCRRCHMLEDGRILLFVEVAKDNAAAKTGRRTTKPCKQCRIEANPLSKGLCKRCYAKSRSRQDNDRRNERRRIARITREPADVQAMAKLYRVTVASLIEPERAVEGVQLEMPL